MHEEYYGFTEKPFSLTPDPKYLYKSQSHASAFDLLQYAIRRREGFVVVTGDIGTGKTTLCRAVLDHLDRKTFTALVLNPFLSDVDLLRLILQDFGVVSREEVKRGRLAPVSKQQLIDTLNDFLLSLQPLGAGALLIIDEAQNLPPQVLEQIRILSNLETHKEKLLQIVLVGQLNLRDQLRSPELRQLDQRISIRNELKPLTREETAAYIAHRLTIAGGGAVVSFAPKAVDLVHRHTRGIPRLINMLCDRALLGGYAARTARITPEIVNTAAASLELKAPSWALPAWRRPSAGSFAAGAAAMLLLAAGLYLGGLVQNGRASATAAAPAAQGVPVPSGPEPAAAAATPGQPETPVRADPSPMPGPQVTPPPAPANAAPGPVPLERGQYSVLVGSFRQPVEAERLMAELVEQGYQVRSSRAATGTRGVWHQVFAGPYADVEAARQAEARIRRLPGYGDARLISR